MPGHTGRRLIGFTLSLVAPARNLSKVVRVLVPTGASIMIFSNIAQNSLIAMLVAIIITALGFLAINYLTEYRDWKYDKQLEYVDALNKLGKDAKKPDLAFSSIYIITLIVSLIIVSVVAAFTVPLLVKWIVTDPELAAEPSTYFVVSFIFVALLALFVDKAICRPVADGSFKARESELEELVIEELERKFKDTGPVTLSNEVQAAITNAIAAAINQANQPK